MRSESANRFGDASADVPFRACPYGSQPRPAIIQLEEGRNLAAAHWVPGVGGVALISDEGGRYDHQQLFFVTPSGLARPLALPGFLRSPVNEVLLVQRSQPLIVIGEAWWTGDERTRWLMEDVFGKPDHGDLVAMDFSGAQRARHRSAHWASLSPDFRWMAYWRSADDGLHNLFVTRPEEESARFVAAIVELDPGSGMSFSECWSADSRFLHVSGSAYGPRSVCWTYDVVAEELYSSDECSPDAIQKREENL